MVLGMAKPKNRKKYHIAWNAWKRCCKKVDSQGGHYKRIRDRFLRDQVYRESQLKIGWTKQKCIEMDELAQQDYTYSLSEEEFKIYQGEWYLTLNKSGKNAPLRLRSDFELQSHSRTVSIVNQVKKLQNQYLHNNTGDGTVIPGGTGTRPKAGGAHDKIFKRSIHPFLLQLVSFTADGDLV